MTTPSPTVQEETEGSQSVQEATVETSPAFAEPAFTGPAPALWTGFGAFVLVFIIVILLIIRGRVVQPAQRKAARADFFEPAGESAEITFDEDAPPQAPPPAEPEPRPEPEPAQEDARADADADRLEAPPPAAEAPAPHKQADQSRRSPFSNLFSKQPKPEPEPPAPQPTVEIEATETPAPTPQPAEAFAPESAADNSRQPLAAPSSLREMDDAVEARRRAAEISELRRLEAEQETMRRRAQETAARARDAKREAEFERRKQEAALEQRLETRLENRFGAASVERSLSEASEALRSDIDHARRRLDVSLEERFGSLARELHGRLDALAAQTPSHGAAEDRPGVSEAYFTEFADLIGEQIASLRETVVASIDALSRRVDELQTAKGGDMGDPGDLARRIADLNRTLGAGAASAAAPRIQLTEILAAALPPNRYERRRRLSNNKTADALIAMPNRLKPIAVDARFPVEAFDAYMRGKDGGAPDAADKAETEFRRVTLRHLVEIAEGLIVAGETADCAFMFTPSERILSELHATFSDLVQESYRANVWMVSPASLMATLNTLNAVMEETRDADQSPAGENAAPPAPQPAAQNIISPNHWESAALHAADHLFQPATQHPPHTDVEQPGEQTETAEADEHSLSPEEEAYERLEREEALADKTDPPHSPTPPRPPFPLR